MFLLVYNHLKIQIAVFLGVCLSVPDPYLLPHLVLHMCLFKMTCDVND